MDAWYYWKKREPARAQTVQEIIDDPENVAFRAKLVEKIPDASE